MDPGLNPITRRPGPGRGRPRKQPSTPITGAGALAPEQPQPDMVGAVPGAIPGALPGVVPGAIPDTVSDGVPGTVPGTIPGSVPGAEAVSQPESLALDSQVEELEEPDTKRPRLDPTTDPALEDAVLGLASHNTATPVDQYDSE